MLRFSLLFFILMTVLANDPQQIYQPTEGLIKLRNQGYETNQEFDLEELADKYNKQSLNVFLDESATIDIKPIVPMVVQFPAIPDILGRPAINCRDENRSAKWKPNSAHLSLA
ncbi:uncharacterized protein LOC132193026 [Neocloeon triangulifer]|uniref:uncharacterized protein LOC132193026 n=1 Tax=Neocloeon triangulifer TaxID=2078957 RepID=UPI00286F466F|nr:uncharacterized protein LOC132193026 [Neocloeon triangulifer]